MAKRWYPVIDYSKCTECGACVKMCKHGVYDKAKAPSPVVIFPDGCVQGCHGCGKRCPKDAISYVGDMANHNTKPGCSCRGNNGGRLK